MESATSTDVQPPMEGATPTDVQPPMESATHPMAVKYIGHWDQISGSFHFCLTFS